MIHFECRPPSPELIDWVSKALGTRTPNQPTPFGRTLNCELFVGPWGARAVNALMAQVGDVLNSIVPVGHVVTIKYTGFAGSNENYPQVVVNGQKELPQLSPATPE